MGIRYKLVQRKDFSKGAGPDAKLYYPQLLNNGNISFDELCDSIAQETALSSADVKGVMDRLARLTSLNQPMEEMGRAAAGLLLARIERPDAPIQSLRLPL